MKPLTFLVALAALSSLAPAQVNGSVDANAFGRFLAHPRLYDGLTIGTALGPPVAHPLPGDPYLASQPFRVEDSRAFAPGAVVDVFYAFGGGGSAVSATGLPGAPPPPAGTPLPRLGAPAVGARALLVGPAAQGGRLPMAWGVLDEADAEWLPLGESSRPALFQMTLVSTSRTRLAPVADPKWRFLESLAAAIPGTPDANARAIADLISIDRANRRPFGVADDRLSRTFADAVAKDTPYHRALVDYALNRLGYWGYGDRFRVDMRAAADDPNAFPDGVPSLQFDEHSENGGNPLLPKSFRHVPPLAQSDILALLVRAKSPTIAETYLGVLYQKPADADVKALAARFLDAPDPRLRRAMVERLAAWEGLPAPEPVKETVDDQGVRHYVAPPGLDATAVAWKRRLGLH